MLNFYMESTSPREGIGSFWINFNSVRSKVEQDNMAWAYVQKRIEEHVQSPAPIRTDGFFAIFHDAWSRDIKNNKDTSYDKEAWIQVQRVVDIHLYISTLKKSRN